MLGVIHILDLYLFIIKPSSGSCRMLGVIHIPALYLFIMIIISIDMLRPEGGRGINIIFRFSYF